MCKHVSAVLYGIGARLDARPELLFTLRGVSDLGVYDEAGVLAKGTPADPIEGFPAWTIEGKVHVTLTSRLVIASSERPVAATENGSVLGVVDRDAALQAIAGEGG